MMFPRTPLSRRDMLRRATLGFGSLALADLLTRRAAAATVDSPLAAKPPMFPAKAKRIIYIFLDGGMSQVDSYDYKPKLQADTGKLARRRAPARISSTGRSGGRSPTRRLAHRGENLALVKFFASESEARTEHLPKICVVLASVDSITTSM